MRDAADFEVGPDPATAEGLLPSCFTEPGFLARELGSIFRHAWLMVPERTASELAGDGQSLADLVRLRGGRAPVTVAAKPLFLQRDWDGVLRAFPNVCTHAWHTLVHGPERERTIVCAQHGRRFDTTGAFQSQPGFSAGGAGFPRDCDSLQAFPVATWGPLTWVKLEAKDAAEGHGEGDLATLLAPLSELLGSLPLDTLVRKPQSSEWREVPGNWKQHALNYLDASHIPFVHARPGGLVDALEMDSYKTELHGDAVLQWAYAKDPAHGFDPDLLPARFKDPSGRLVYALWWFVYPNLALNFYPWGLSVNQYVPVPGRPDRTLFLWYQWSWSEALFSKRHEAWQLQSVDDEDVDAMGKVARGLASGFAVRGRFSQEEAAAHWFHRRVALDVAQGN